MKKQLGLFTVFSIASGAMISSGLFILPGLAFARTGPSVFISYFLAGLLAMTTVFSLAELSTAMPKAGGDYFFINRTFGSLLGTVSGFLSWFALSLKSAFAILGISELLSVILGFNLTVSALILCVVFVIVNLLGAKEAAGVQAFLVAGLLVILGVFAVAGITKVNPGSFTAMLPRGTNALFSTAGFVFVSFGGLLTTASIAEEVRDPRKNIPRGLLLSIISVTILYAFISFILVGVLPAKKLAGSVTPVADAARALLGEPGFIAITIASLLAFVTTANGGILTAARYPVAMARDRLLPGLFGRIREKSGVPVAAVLLTGIFISFSLFLKLDVLVKAASTVVLLTNILANLSLIILHESRLQNYRPSFRALGYPWLQLVSVILFAGLIVDMGLQPALLSLIFIFAGVILYFVYGRKRAHSESAFMHLMERITNRRLTNRGLEVELREIVFQRDDIEQDCFDDVIHRAAVLDLKDKTDAGGLFRAAARELAKHRCCPGIRRITALLREREEESSTAITPFAAVPHLVLEGEGVFELLLVRSKKGVYFTERCPKVHAVFFLMGTRDRRNLHLRALAAIAQSIQSDRFEERWLKAKRADDLGDLLLLSGRRR